jgi:hypothetical protein
MGIAIPTGDEVALAGGVHLGRSEEKEVAPAGPVVHGESDRAG